MAEFINTVDVLGDDALTDSIIDRSITEYCDDSIKKIGNYAFRGCTSLTTANFPAVTTIGTYAFNGCSQLTTANFPSLTSIDEYVFSYCSALTTADFSAVKSITRYAFEYCTNLETLILRYTTQVVSMSYATAFRYTKLIDGVGYIYVPAALIDGYKADTTWKRYANQFRALEDYTVDGTTTGELDPNKI